MTVNETKEWLKSFLPKDDSFEMNSSNIDACNGYSTLLHTIDEMFNISENDANAIIEFMHNKGIKLKNY